MTPTGTITRFPGTLFGTLFQALFTALLALALFGAEPSASAQIFETDFDDQTSQGWTGFGVRDPGPVLVAPGPSGALDDYYLEVTDRASTGGIPGLNLLAPAEMTGRYGTIADTCGALELDVRVLDDQGGALSFQVHFATDPDGFLTGNDPVLRARFLLDDPIDEGDGWRRIVVPLARRAPNGDLPSNGEGRWEMVAGASDAEWNALLDDVDLVYLPLEINGGTFEKIGIDNVRLVSGECPCPEEPNFFERVGVEDEFAAPAESTRRVFLGSVQPPLGWKALDDPQTNRWIGHTFRRLPPAVVEAELEIRMRPGASGQIGNDTLNLGLRSGGSFAYSTPIADLPEANGTWTTNQNLPTTFRIPISSALLDEAKTKRRLEMVIQDDTTVDYAVLRMRRCPPPVDSSGNPWTVDDLTNVSPDLGGWTVSGSLVGLDFETGDSSGNCVGTVGLCLGLGTALDLAAMGYTDERDEFGQPFGTLSFASASGGVEVISDFFENFLSRTYVRLDGDFVASDVGDPGVVAVLPPEVCIEEIDFIDGQCFQVQFTEPIEILLPRSGTTTLGDELRVCRDLLLPMRVAPARLERFQVLAEGFDEFRITDVAVQQFDALFRAIGEANLEATAESVVVSNLSGGDDGVAVDFEDSGAVRLEWAPSAPTPGEPRVLEIETRGRFGDAGPGSLGSVRFADDGSGSIDLSTVFPGIDARTLRIFRDGEPVLEQTTPFAPEIVVATLPSTTSALVLPDRPAATVCEWPDATVFTVDGIEVVGDEIRVEAPGTAGIGGSIRECLVRPEGFETITLTDASSAGDCEAGGTELCLQGDRFEVEVTWNDLAGEVGSGRAVPLSTDTGYFWFFDEANVEVVVKVLDGRPLNGNFWVFYGALSNVEYEIRVTDTTTGLVQTYLNPADRFASVGDTAAFTGDGFPGGGFPGGGSNLVDREIDLHRDLAAFSPAEIAGSATSKMESKMDCVAGAQNLCLNAERFRVEVEWVDFAGTRGTGTAVPLTADTGYFWFFDAANVELIVKVLDGRAINGNFWVFYGALSNVEYRLTVTDTVTGAVSVYENPLGTFASQGDVSAFEEP